MMEFVNGEEDDSCDILKPVEQIWRSKKTMRMSLNGNLLIWHNLIFVYSITTLGAALPLSIGGLGIREGILSVMLILLGLDNNIAVSVALLNLMFLWLIAFTGGMLFLFSKKIYQR